MGTILMIAAFLGIILNIYFFSSAIKDSTSLLVTILMVTLILINIALCILIVILEILLHSNNLI